jgi:addiction module HigA family antidote
MNNMRPIHPGEIIKEEYLEPLNMSANALAIALRVPAPRINDVIRQKRGISIDTALRLARYFNSTPQFWMNLQVSYDLEMAKQSVAKIENEIFTELNEYKIVFGKVEKVFDITNRTFDFRASVLKKSYAIYDVNTRK